jgi:16S rRNA (adenine1518-N6/adenine1519-N6)-dimethyltransferase
VSKKESILSLSVKAYGSPRITDKVPKKHFSPPPSVDSAILVIDSVSKSFFDIITERDFFRVVHAGFASKRKFVSNNLATVFGKDAAQAALAHAGVAEKARAEDIPLTGWKLLTQSLAASNESA